MALESRDIKELQKIVESQLNKIFKEENSTKSPANKRNAALIKTIKDNNIDSDVFKSILDKLESQGKLSKVNNKAITDALTANDTLVSSVNDSLKNIARTELGITGYMKSQEGIFSKFIVEYKKGQKKAGPLGGVGSLFKGGIKSLLNPINAIKATAVSMAALHPAGLVAGLALVNFAENINRHNNEWSREKEKEIKNLREKGLSASEALSAMVDVLELGGKKVTSKTMSALKSLSDKVDADMEGALRIEEAINANTLVAKKAEENAELRALRAEETEERAQEGDTGAGGVGLFGSILALAGIKKFSKSFGSLAKVIIPIVSVVGRLGFTFLRLLGPIGLIITAGYLLYKGIMYLENRFGLVTKTIDFIKDRFWYLINGIVALEDRFGIFGATVDFVKDSFWSMVTFLSPVIDFFKELPSKLLSALQMLPFGIGRMFKAGAIKKEQEILPKTRESKLKDVEVKILETQKKHEKQIQEVKQIVPSASVVVNQQAESRLDAMPTQIEEFALATFAKGFMI